MQGFYVSALLGLLVVGVEAHRQFSVLGSSSNPGKYNYPILNDVALEALAPRYIFLRGYWFYVGTYLLLFLLCISTVALGDLVLWASSSIKEAGGQGVLPFSNTSPSVPNLLDVRVLAIATGLVTLSGTGLAAGVERYIRRLSHRLAGIPHNIYRVIQRINQIDFSEVVEDEAGIFGSKLDQLFERLGKSNVSAFLREDQREELINACQTIDTLSPPLVGVYADQVFPIDDVEAQREIIRKGKEEINALETFIDGLLKKRENFERKENWIELLEKCTACKRSQQALFSVLFTRTNGQGLGSIHLPTTKIVEKLLTHDPDHLRHSATLAVLSAALIGMLVSGATEVLAQLLSGRCSAFFSCLLEDSEFIANNSLRFAGIHALTFTIAVFVALDNRQAMADFDNYPKYTLSRVPYLLVLRISIWSALLGAIAYLAFSLGLDIALGSKLQANGEISLPNSTIVASSLSIHFWGALGTLLCLIFLGLGILLIADQHWAYSRWRTVSIGLLFGSPMILVKGAIVLTNISGQSSSERMKNFTYAVQDGASSIVIFLLFLLFFAISVEAAENVEDQNAL